MTNAIALLIEWAESAPARTWEMRSWNPHSVTNALTIRITEGSHQIEHRMSSFEIKQAQFDICAKEVERLIAKLEHYIAMVTTAAAKPEDSER